jgi:hypothetical protein
MCYATQAYTMPPSNILKIMAYDQPMWKSFVHFHPIHNIANQHSKDFLAFRVVIVLITNHHHTTDTTYNNRVQRSLQMQLAHMTSHIIYLSRSIKTSVNIASTYPNCMVDTTSLIAKITRGSVNDMTNWDSYSLHLPSRREDTRQQLPPQSQPL